MYELKEIQRDCARSIHLDLFNNNCSKVLASIATGWGKTILASKMCEVYINKYNYKCLFLANRSELINQTVDKFLKASNITCEIEQAEKRALLDSKMVVASCQTMAKADRLKRFDKKHFDFIIIDEAHGALSDQYQVILNHFQAKYLFLTATADKLIDADLFDIVDKVSYEFTLKQSVEAGYNVKPIVRPIFLNKSLIKDDLENDDLDNLLCKIMPAILTEIKNACRDKKTIVFLPSIERSKKTAQQLEELGFNALHCDGYMSDSKRREVLEKFNRAGLGSIMCNPTLLGTGYDQPDIDCVVVLRNVSSRALYAQMVGRALRVSSGKDHGLILDFLGLTAKYNITASIDEISKIKRVFQEMKEGQEIDLIARDEKALRDAEKTLAIKLLAQAEKEKKQRFVSISQIEKVFNLRGFADKWMKKEYFDNYDRITVNQVERLHAFGVSMKGLSSMEQANYLIDFLTDRSARNLATPKQVRLLASSYNKEAIYFTKEQARDKIMQMKARQDWRKL